MGQSVLPTGYIYKRQRTQGLGQLELTGTTISDKYVLLNQKSYNLKPPFRSPSGPLLHCIILTTQKSTQQTTPNRGMPVAVWSCLNKLSLFYHSDKNGIWALRNPNLGFRGSSSSFQASATNIICQVWASQPSGYYIARLC